MGASLGDENGMELLLATAQQDYSETGDDGSSRHGLVFPDSSTNLTKTIETIGNDNSSSLDSVSMEAGPENSGTAPTLYNVEPVDRDEPYIDKSNLLDLVANSSEGEDVVSIYGHSGEDISPGRPAELPMRLSDLNTGLGEARQIGTARRIFSEGGDLSVMLATTYTRE